MKNPSTDSSLLNLWMVLLAFGFAIVTPIHARSDLSKNQARKLIQTMAGWSLPGSAVRVSSVNSSDAENAEVSAEIQTIFRLRLKGGSWQLSEIRTGQDRWERLDVIAQAAKVELPSGECDALSQFVRSRSSSQLTNKRARCLVASLLGVQLPSDDVRIKDVSPFGLSIGPESSALVTALIRADFRFAQGSGGWRLVEFKSGNREWVRVTDLPAAMDQIKRSTASEELSTIAKALSDFRRDRGAFVISDNESVLIDHLSPRYLTRVIRVDPWHRPYQYEGQQNSYSLRSLGPDGKPNTPDDIVVSGP
ncbi:MAG TPA: type II secretion system protein GspG [Pyrinomonadaceae bacterium]|nr:type II secretion system protein GspG [Pyrinomonadaceae bacterium]